MSHFALTVALPAHVPAAELALRRAVAESLTPFDATREVERYREYTRDELIAKGRAEIEARAGDITPDSHNPSMAYVDPAGRWHDTSQPGWAVPNDPNDPWRCQYGRWIESLDPQTWLVKVDCHIELVPPPGLEPGTCGLKVRSSTN